MPLLARAEAPREGLLLPIANQSMVPSGASETPADGLAGPLALPERWRGDPCRDHCAIERVRAGLGPWARPASLCRECHGYTRPSGKVVARVSGPVSELPVPVPTAGARPSESRLLRDEKCGRFPRARSRAKPVKSRLRLFRTPPTAGICRWQLRPRVARCTPRPIRGAASRGEP